VHTSAAPMKFYWGDEAVQLMVVSVTEVGLGLRANGPARQDLRFGHLVGGILQKPTTTRNTREKARQERPADTARPG
jgi:hypothetical protein